METKEVPSRVLFVKETPPERIIGRSSFEELFKHPNFVNIRYYAHYAYVEYTSVESATEMLQKLNGHRFNDNDPPLRVTYDREGGKRKSKRKFSDEPYGRPHDDYYYHAGYSYHGHGGHGGHGGHPHGGHAPFPPREPYPSDRFFPPGPPRRPYYDDYRYSFTFIFRLYLSFLHLLEFNLKSEMQYKVAGHKLID
eukprot:TRINITY_DN6723_c0_g1_i3.p1 TRINITY_DN6723_c0_g1~~TRINITY_DN6723_c0_g1_i3.p1  ORF type:complete len:208 (-),score=13.44 TRINITY_DN6723_c0_g1_i3:9-593(-)